MRSDHENDRGEATVAVATGDAQPWRDSTLPDHVRVADLLGRMTLEEKVAQLYSVWLGVTGDDEVAPHQHTLADENLDWRTIIKHGLGQITRPFGTAPIEPTEGLRVLARLQRDLVQANRFGIPAQIHEECLAGFTAWKATVYPVPLCWGASFDPELVGEMAGQIGASMHRMGIHQGLAPVLDVTRDPRWGRTEETIGEDPYLVATVATAYVRGLESSGIVATLKHFVGYSASKAARNLAPVAVGPRELADVLLPPFEMAVRHGGVRSVMHSYSEIDGVPAAADRSLLTGLLREQWGFDGTVVADYFGISFLETLHGVAGNPAEAAALALEAGIDVELPSLRCYAEPLVNAVREGTVSEDLVDLAVTRVLTQKCQLGLLDPEWKPAAAEAGEVIDLDPPQSRAIARRIAEESVVLMANDGVLPLRSGASIAVVGPVADEPGAMMGCYSFPSHVGSQHPHLPIGVEVPSLLQAIKAEGVGTSVEYAKGCGVDEPETSGIAEAAALAARSDVCVVVLGDRSGLFGRGTSGEGCDAEDLALPGVQGQLLDAVLATGTPVVLVTLAGRPYALGAYAERTAAILTGFFPGEEGGPAIAGVLSGRVCPSGRLPVSVPRRPGGQPTTYLAPSLGQATEVSSVDPTPLYPFGHGLSFTEFTWSDPTVDGKPADGVAEFPTDGSFELAVMVRNTGKRAGAEIVQLYLHDPVAQVTRPVVRLVGYARVALEPGEARRVSFSVHADLSSFTGRAGRRIVEPGDLEFRFGASSADVRFAAGVRLVGQQREVGSDRHLVTEVTFA